MAEVGVFTAGGYRYIKAGFQYSSGVAAEPGYAIEHARFLEPLPLAEAFAAVEAHLAALGRPTTAFAQCELRSPAPFSDQEFHDFNKAYVRTLEGWGLYTAGDAPINPVARTNVCPMYNKPSAPSMHAFSYTVPAADSKRATFVLAGGGDARGGSGSYRDRIVAADDTSPEGLRQKVEHVVAMMERRLQALGLSWRDAATTQAYSVQNIGHLVGEMLARRGAMEAGLVWHYARPPIVGLEYEMDVRCAARELVL